jgi:ribonuclease M5
MKIKLNQVVLVEGKYDKIKLSSLLDATILTTDGFGIFKEAEKRALLRRLAAERGIIVVTDSDGAGRVIRGHIASILPKEQVVNLYIPKIKGKEARKAAPSKEGTLGVEGMDADLLRSLFAPYAVENKRADYVSVDRWRYYEDGFTGGPNSSRLRAELSKLLDLPDDLSANALLEAINLLGGLPLYENALARMGFPSEEA